MQQADTKNSGLSLVEQPQEEDRKGNGCTDSRHTRAFYDLLQGELEQDSCNTQHHHEWETAGGTKKARDGQDD